MAVVVLPHWSILHQRLRDIRRTEPVHYRMVSAARDGCEHEHCERYANCGAATRGIAGNRLHFRIVSERGDLARAQPHQLGKSETQFLPELRSPDRMV